MKKISAPVFLTGLMCLSTVACKVDNPALEKERVRMAFTTETCSTSSRTAIDGTTVTWTENDRICIFDGSCNNCFDLTDGAGSPTATFEGEAVGNAEYTALYPYSETAGYHNGTITSNLPGTQYSVADRSFDTMLNPSVATAEGRTLHFRNVAGLMRIHVDGLPEGTDVESIEIRADKSLAGDYMVDMSAEIPAAVPTVKSSPGVTLTGKDGDAMAEGPYHLVVFPGEYGYMTVTVIFSDGTHARKTSSGMEIQAGGIASLSIDASDAVEGLPERDPYQDFLERNDHNLLLDFSYAGYNHGETAPEEVIVSKNSDGSYSASNGYKVYDIEDYGADGTDGLSDRKAFIDMLTDALGEPETNESHPEQITFPHSNTGRNIILYFPEGNFILHDENDDIVLANSDLGKVSQSIIIRGSNIILKGAGADLTTISMNSPNIPENEQILYSSPDMLQFKHNTGIQPGTVLADVTGDSPKGSFSVTVDGTGSLQSGDWVCLYLKNTSSEVVAAELAPYTAESSWAIAGNYGVSVQDLHRIKSVSGNTVTFCEPLMHEIDAGWNWKIVRYQHYENVGIEDLTFAGNAKDDFIHHGSWEDDGAYKPVSMTRLTDSWMRRVRFLDVSEACSVISCANVSVYDADIEGSRGHSAIRSQGSSRVFIGACRDMAEVSGTESGQYHSFGVSKESIGAVLWRNTWGGDTNFESHATQPRATLLDCCSGGWIMLRAGGDAAQAPNHLNDLTVWNFNSTTTYSGTWLWWDMNNRYWKFLPPVIVGFHGADVEFDQAQTKADISHGRPVQPESLYEAQLQHRLGYVPGWLLQLK